MSKKTKTDINTSLQEFYRPKQVAELLGVSLRTYYTLIEKGKLHPIKLSERVTIISRKEIFEMIENALGETLSKSIFAKGKKFGQDDYSDVKSTDGNSRDNKTVKRKSDTTAKDRAPLGVTHDTHYTMAEICAKYDYSYGRFYTLRMRYNIPKVHAFGTSCFPKGPVDKAIAEEKQRLGKTLTEHWYTCGELMRIYGLGKTQVRRFATTHNVRMKKANGNRLYYLKEEWEAERRKAEGKSNSTKERRVGAS